jgi:hypothetical protein
MPLKPLQYLTKLASDWGNPQITAEPAEGSRAFSSPIPDWEPGEFEEWKRAKVMKVPTKYGLNRQALFNASKIPSMAYLMTQHANRSGYNMLGDRIEPSASLPLMSLLRGKVR